MKGSAQKRRRWIIERWNAVRRYGNRVGTAFLRAFMACFCMPIERKSSTPNTESNAEPVQEHDGMDYRVAFETLCELRGSQLLAAKELLYTHVQMLIEQNKALLDPNRISGDGSARRPGESAADELRALLQKPSTHEVPWYKKFIHLWTVPRIRRATGCAIVCML